MSRPSHLPDHERILRDSLDRLETVAAWQPWTEGRRRFRCEGIAGLCAIAWVWLDDLEYEFQNVSQRTELFMDRIHPATPGKGALCLDLNETFAAADRMVRRLRCQISGAPCGIANFHTDAVQMALDVVQLAEKAITLTEW